LLYLVEVVEMWTVISEMGPDGPEYIVINKQTGERKGKSDCEPWAQEFADELNREGIQ
jgi:hypothetical protein